MTGSESESLYRRRPCEECRDRKRKCSFGEPCERCERLNRPCIYPLQPSPNDQEYLRELEHLNEIKALQKQLRKLENEVGALKVAQEKAYLENYPSPPPDIIPSTMPSKKRTKKTQRQTSVFESDTSEDIEADDEEEEDDTRNTQPHYNNSNNRKRIQNHVPMMMIARSNQCKVFVNKNKDQDQEDTKSWKLRVQNGNMIVETRIQTHSDLLKNLEAILCNLKASSSTPGFINPANPDNKDILTLLCTIVWKRYAKTRFDVLTHCAPVDLAHNPNAQMARVNSPQDLLKITMKIVHAYFECHYLTQFTVHKPTFIKFFMRSASGSIDILSSPAVMSLCGTACLYACKHIGDVLPYNSLTDYALFYFEQARELIGDRFDECSLEMLCAYTLLGTHKIKLREDTLGMQYIELARRIYDVLEPEYKHRLPDSGEYAMIKRLYRLIQQSSTIIEIHYHEQHYLPKFHIGLIRFFNLMDSGDDIEIEPEVDDSEKEIAYIKVRKQLSDLRRLVRHGNADASSETLPAFVDEFSHRFEMTERHWYRHILPAEYQLSLPLFDDQMSDLDFFIVLEKECGDHDALRLLPIIGVYHEYLVMARSYLPTTPNQLNIDADRMLFDLKWPESGHVSDVEIDDKWRAVLAFIPLYREINPLVRDHEATQRGLIDGMLRAVKSRATGFDLPLTHVAVRAAFNMVRLLQFLVSRSYTCFLDMRWLLSAWEILLRAARFEYQQPGVSDKSVTMNRVRANMYILLDVILKHVLNARFDTVKHLYQDLNNQLKEVFE